MGRHDTDVISSNFSGPARQEKEGEQLIAYIFNSLPPLSVGISLPAIKSQVRQHPGSFFAFSNETQRLHTVPCYLMHAW